ncbi:D-alanyl-lipoteichoic acid biosynthesis protein DltD [Bacillus sp. FJAT-49736]|uniref:D-alanyl-lipoteichoic acid biosynthesis protein DltD n=1 Tax=Bacillus sp. FJAT-49736 TaxID=2833582 RepID=UPI001BCA5300|nr:D-alanyl-lipoteichoic acid biosynthesis protein DltD [Bacillus sp. FJAT-49736]MBS4175323.1 D-alanyl-lipoteichoic acid biosynthesis protein DltD [Bacillus sp. FJAT-49736]
MRKYAFGPLIIAIVLFLGLLFVPNAWIGHLISNKKVEKDATTLSPLMFQGDYVQSRMLKDDKYFPIYGSSELSRFDPFHPSNYFEANPQGFTPFLVGRGGTQSLVQFMNFAAHADQIKGKKLVFIISPQWFHKGGIDSVHFDPNYSMLQAYDLAFNKDIDPRLKREAIRRLLKFDVVKRDYMLSAMYRSEISHPTGPTKWKDNAIKPLAYMNWKLLEKKDLYYSLYGGYKHKLYKDPKLVKGKSWGELKQLATQYGEKRAKGNPFDVTDSFYKKKVLPIQHRMRNHNRHATYANSIEYKDFQMILDLLKEKGAEPIFVTIPVNGKWYDYTGFPKEGRDVFYKKIKKQVEAEGFPIVDLSGHEYDPYFLKDTMHISWKGWVYVDKAMEQHWKTKNPRVD